MYSNKSYPDSKTVCLKLFRAYDDMRTYKMSALKSLFCDDYSKVHLGRLKPHLKTCAKLILEDSEENLRKLEMDVKKDFVTHIDIMNNRNLSSAVRLSSREYLGILGEACGELIVM